MISLNLSRTLFWLQRRRGTVNWWSQCITSRLHSGALWSWTLRIRTIRCSIKGLFCGTRIFPDYWFEQILKAGYASAGPTGFICPAPTPLKWFRTRFRARSVFPRQQHLLQPIPILGHSFPSCRLAVLCNRYCEHIKFSVYNACDLHSGGCPARLLQFLSKLVNGGWVSYKVDEEADSDEQHIWKMGSLLFRRKIIIFDRHDNFWCVFSLCNSRLFNMVCPAWATQEPSNWSTV